MRAGSLLDTDWIIDHLNGVAAVAARLKELQPAGLAASIISLAELYEGVHYSRDPVRSETSLQQFLTGLSILPIDDEVCRIFGRERGRLRTDDRRLRLADSCDLSASPAPDLHEQPPAFRGGRGPFGR